MMYSRFSLLLDLPTVFIKYPIKVNTRNLFFNN